MTPKPTHLHVRLDEETMEALRLAAGEPERGRASGVGLFVRRLIAEALNRPLARQYHAAPELVEAEPAPEVEFVLKATARELREAAKRLEATAAAMRRQRRRRGGEVEP